MAKARRSNQQGGSSTLNNQSNQEGTAMSEQGSKEPVLNIDAEGTGTGEASEILDEVKGLPEGEGSAIIQEEGNDTGQQEESTTPAPQATAAAPAPAPMVSPTVQEVAKPAAVPEDKPVPATTPNSDDYDTYLSKAVANGTPAQKLVISIFKDFEESFVPRQAYEASAAFKAQWNFLTSFESILNLPYDKFQPAWNTALVYVYKNIGVNTPKDYSAISIYNTDRYLNLWKRSQESRNAYSHLFILLRNTADPKTRNKALKEIVLERVGQGFFSDDAINNLRSFYNV